MNPPMRLTTLAAIAILLGVSGCPSDPEPLDSATVVGADVPGDAPPPVEVPPGAICTPGSVKDCTPDGKMELVCTTDGMGWDTRSCRDDQDDLSICVNGACLPCLPANKRCRDDDTVELCAEDGAGWVTAESCNGQLTGQVCNLGACVSLCEINIKWNSYMGCEYWAADLDNGFVPGPNGGALDAAGAQYAIIVSNPDDKYPVEVEIWDSSGPVTHDSKGVPFPTGKILPRDLRVYKMPRRDVNGTVQAKLAYRITTSAPAIVYQFNPLADEEVYSNDASLLLPIHVLDKWYMVMTRMQTFEGIRAYLSVLGTRDDTEVTVQVSARTLAGQDIPALAPGETLTRTLSAFDVLNIETDGLGEDLTGSVVLANRRVAVFGGSEGANAPNTDRCDPATSTCEWDGETACATNADCSKFITCCADHIEQALFPVTTWGLEYVAARTIPRGDEPEVWRILAAADNTVVETIPNQANIAVLDAGEWFEFESGGDFEIKANKPVLIGQFMTAEQAPGPGYQSGDAGIGDPAFMLVPPSEQFRTDYVVLSPPEYDEDFINVIAPLGAEVLLDGVLIADGEFEPVGTGKWRVARLPVADGVHTIVSEQKVGVQVYGFDQYVSYAYPGGLDLQNLELIKPPQSAGGAP